MPDQPPDHQPQGPSQEWNQINAKEIEETITSAADLAYELAGDIGRAKTAVPHRDESGLEPIESTLDAELKQLDHLVRKTQEHLAEPSPATRKVAAVPDFMAEFMSEGPVALVPETEARNLPAQEGQSNQAHPARPEFSENAPPKSHESKLGLVGVGTLGDRREKKSDLDSPEYDPLAPESSHPTLMGRLEKLVYRSCCAVTFTLELLDRPLVGLSHTTRRTLGVTAIAAFFTCLAMLVLSLLFS